MPILIVKSLRSQQEVEIRSGSELPVMTWCSIPVYADGDVAEVVVTALEHFDQHGVVKRGQS